VELRASSITLNPRRWKPGWQEFATNERLAELIFDRLVALDNYGRFQPQLAREWSHDSSAKRWQFTLRQGVKFSDGTLLAPSDVVAALQPLLATGMQISTTPTGVTIQSANPASDLLELLASGSHFIYRSDEQGNLLGTGPFVLENAALNSASPRAEKWADGAAPQTSICDFALTNFAGAGGPFVTRSTRWEGLCRAPPDYSSKADLAELEDTALRAQQSNAAVGIFALTLYAVKFSAPPKSANDRTREALSLSRPKCYGAGVAAKQPAAPPSCRSGSICFSLRYGKQSERAKEFGKPDGKFAGCLATSLNAGWQQ
jgi:hypothetical protein